MKGKIPNQLISLSLLLLLALPFGAFASTNNVNSDPISSITASVLDSVTSFWDTLFGGNPSVSQAGVATSSSQPVESSAPTSASIQTVNTTSIASTTPTPTVVYKYIPSQTQSPAFTGITESELNTKLATLQSYLLNQIASIHPTNATTTVYEGEPSVPVLFTVPGASFNQLNPTVTSLTANDNITAGSFIGDGSGLTGSPTFTDLTVSGTSTFAGGLGVGTANNATGTLMTLTYGGPTYPGIFGLPTLSNLDENASPGLAIVPNGDGFLPDNSGVHTLLDLQGISCFGGSGTAIRFGNQYHTGEDAPSGSGASRIVNYNALCGYAGSNLVFQTGSVSGGYNSGLSLNAYGDAEIGVPNAQTQINSDNTESLLVQGQTNDSSQSALTLINASSSPLLDVLNNGDVGIGTTTPSQALTVSGEIESSNLFGGATTLSVDANGNIIRTPSDQNLKTDIQSISSQTALTDILALNPVTFDYKNPEVFGAGQQIGFIAQQVQPILPQLVSTGGAYESLNYSNLTAVLTGAVQQQQLEINSLSSSTQALLQGLNLNISATTTPTSITTSIFSALESDISSWLADASNGITDIYANVFHAQEVDTDRLNTNNLCVGTVCVTQEQFLEMIQNSGQAPEASTTDPSLQTSGVGYGSQSFSGPDSSSTDETDATSTDETTGGSTDPTITDDFSSTSDVLEDDTQATSSSDITSPSDAGTSSDATSTGSND